MSTADLTRADTNRVPSGERSLSLRVSPYALTAIGGSLLVLSVAVAAFAGDWSRWSHAYLLAVVFFLSINLGAVFFVLLQHLTGARWSVTIRRVAELLTVSTPSLGLLLLPVLVALLFGSSTLYIWNDAQLVDHDALIAHKSVYLNAGFFTARCLVYFAVWTWIGRFLLKNSLRQDDGDGTATRSLARWSGPAMLLLAITMNFAAFDLLMSLDPHWFSTIYGIYFFSGCVVALLATLILAVVGLQQQGRLQREVTVEHFHDLGKLLFGFVFFWGYIAFSQYLLIWYANIPEETTWYAVRQQHGWLAVSLVLLFGHFVLPFFGLMSRGARRNRLVLVGWSLFLLAMHYLDLYWLIMPSVSSERAAFSPLDLMCVAGVGLIWLSVTLRAMSRHRLLGTGDPFLADSLAFHNV